MAKISSSYEDATAKCPFYKSSDARRISCEGVTFGSVLIHSFSSRAKRNMQKYTFCDDKYSYCEVYRMLMEKYED